MYKGGVTKKILQSYKILLIDKEKKNQINQATWAQFDEHKTSKLKNQKSLESSYIMINGHYAFPYEFLLFKILDLVIVHGVSLLLILHNVIYFD